MVTLHASNAPIRIRTHANEMEDEVRRAKERVNLVGEIVKTESIYVETLNGLIHDYHGVRVGVDERIWKEMFPQSLLLLRDTHDKYLKVLIARQQHWDSESSLVGDILIDLANDVRFLYPQYVSRFNHQIARVKACPAFDATQKSQLLSALIAPVKKIPRLLLLVKALIKHTPATHPDARLLHTACDCFARICDRIEGATDEVENLRRLRTLQETYHVQGLFDHPRRLIVGDETGNILVGGKPSLVFVLTDMLLIVERDGGCVTRVPFGEGVKLCDTGNGFALGSVTLQCTDSRLRDACASRLALWTKQSGGPDQPAHPPTLHQSISEDVEEEDSDDL